MAHRRTVAVEAGPEDHQVDLTVSDLSDLSRYGEWRENKKSGKFLVPHYLSGSDYSGSLVTKSNHRTFQKEFEDGEDVWWKNVHGGHGTYAIVIGLDLVPDSVSSDVADFLNNLNDYPLANEDDHSELEMEAQNEAWERWAKQDFIKGIEKHLGVDLDDADDEKVFELFREASDKSNTYWENQSGDDVHIDVDRIVKKVTKADVKKLLGKKR